MTRAGSRQSGSDMLLIRRCFQSTLSRIYNLDLRVARRLQSRGTPVYRCEEAHGEARRDDEDERRRKIGERTMANAKLARDEEDDSKGEIKTVLD